MTPPSPENNRRGRFRSPYLWPGIALILALSVAGSTFVFADWWQSELESEQRTKRRLLDQAKRRHDTAIEQVEIADNYLGRYNRYLTHRMIGGLDRLHWSDGLQRISRKLGLREMEIAFSGQQELGNDMRRQLKVRERIYKSYNLELSFVAQHEGDLFRFFNQVDHRISPMYLVRGCDLDNRAAGESRPIYRETGNIAVSCTLQLVQAEPRERD